MSYRNSLRRIRRDPLILPFYLPSLIAATSQGLLVPVFPVYAKAFGVSYGLIGLILSAEALGMLAGDVPAGVLLRRMGTKRSMLLGLGGAGLSTLALFWATSVPEAIIYRLIGGFSGALYSVARHGYVVETVVVSNRGRAIALFGGIARIGRFAGPAVGGIVAAAYGLRLPFVLVGGATLVALACVAVFLHPSEHHPQTKSHGSEPQAPHLLSTLKSHYRILSVAGAAQLFAQMIRAGRRAIIPLYAADVIGLDVQAIGFILSISSAADMSLFYPTGQIMDRLGRKYAIVPSFLIQAAGMLFVPLAGSFTGLLVVSTLISLGNGLSSGTMMTLGADLAPKQGRGEFLGLWRLIGDAGRSGGPAIVGAVADLVVLQAAAPVIAGAGFIAGLIFLLFVPETLKKQRGAVVER